MKKLLYTGHDFRRKVSSPTFYMSRGKEEKKVETSQCGVMAGVSSSCGVPHEEGNVVQGDVTYVQANNFFSGVAHPYRALQLCR